MAYVKVNYTNLKQVSRNVDGYATTYKNGIKKVTAVAESLGAQWEGPDYDQWLKECNVIDDVGSVSHKLILYLKNYSSAMMEAANGYKKMQLRALNRSQTLCK